MPGYREFLIHAAYRHLDCHDPAVIEVRAKNITTGERATVIAAVLDGDRPPWATMAVGPELRRMTADELAIVEALRSGPLPLKALVKATGIGRTRLATICGLLVEAGVIVSNRDGYAMPTS